ncbi:MAG TPA: hypothetical protein VFP50_07070 [Anaeromyxobacteraceae bacterium]|nr:hypothetical protein [Anaeromyxobacteraceae bacterium]
MATTHLGTQAVPSGYYLNASRWAIEPVATDGGRLPAGPGTWRRIPTALALLATPVLGLAFLMFLPLIGILLTLQAAVSPLAGLVHGSAAGMAATMSPGWQPGEAHLTGKRAERDAVEAQGPPAEADEELEALQREIERRRRS